MSIKSQRHQVVTSWNQTARCRPESCRYLESSCLKLLKSCDKWSCVWIEILFLDVSHKWSRLTGGTWIVHRTAPPAKAFPTVRLADIFC